MEPTFGASVAQGPATVADRRGWIGGRDSRGDIHNRAAALGDHVVSGPLGQEQRGSEIDEETSLESAWIDIKESIVVSRTDIDRIVDEQIESSPMIDDPVNGWGQGVALAQVEWKRHDLPASGLDRSRGAFEAATDSLLIFHDGAGCDRYGVAISCQFDGHGATDATAGPGDKRSFCHSGSSGAQATPLI